MLKRSIISAALLLTSLSALASPAFYVVIPIPGRAVSNEKILVSLAAQQLPAGNVGKAYSPLSLSDLLTVKGDPAFTGQGVSWAIESGSLPAGLVLNGDGIISGTPTVGGASAFQVKATYKNKSGKQTYEILALDLKVQLASAALPAAIVQQAYPAFDFKAQLTVSGDPSYRADDVAFSAAGLPEGLELTASGSLSGKPVAATAGDGRSFTVVATYKSVKGEQVYTIKVGGQLLSVSKIVGGTFHMCALTVSGGVKCWGAGAQLGNDTGVESSAPVDVQGLTAGVKTISALDTHTCAITAANGAVCWGDNQYGGLGDGTNTSSLVPVPVSGLASNVTSITAGSKFSCAITTAGAARCWGANGSGHLGNNQAISSNGTSHSSVPVAVTGISAGASSITAGWGHACAVVNGAARCWGSNFVSQVGTGVTNLNYLTPQNVSGLSSGIRSVHAGGFWTCAIRTTGQVLCWGDSTDGAQGIPRVTVPTGISGLPLNIKTLAVGMYHACVLSTTGAVSCWGDNRDGELGDGTKVSRQTVRAATVVQTDVSDIFAVSSATCAIAGDNTAKCWGRTRTRAGSTVTPVDLSQ